jgi:cytochrome c peroxidase
VASENGWAHATSVSCLGGVRTFVTVTDPDGRFDQWMLVGLDGTLTHVDNPTIVSFIGVQKKDSSGNTLARVRMHFRDYLASADESGRFGLELPENFGGKCYACHTSGMRELIAAPETGALNERLRAYGLPDWNGAIDPADHGPRLGESLGCTECHNGEDRGVLTVSTSEGMLWQKVVGQLAMRSPHGGAKVPDERAMALLERETTGEPPLTPDEAAELESARAEHLLDYEALVAERFPTWRDWALEVGCE